MAVRESVESLENLAMKVTDEYLQKIFFTELKDLNSIFEND